MIGKLATRASLTACLLIAPLKTASEAIHIPSFFATWNVGQGLWTTWVTDETCLHFDAGGERMPWRKIARACQTKANLFSFSHWDEDHISFAKRARELLPNSCLWHAPGGEGSARKQLLVAALPPCSSLQISESDETSVHEIRASLPRISLRGRHHPANHSNDESRVFVVNHEILAPGDATSREEKTWGAELHKQDLQLLILGHHGSRTSTSTELLENLPHVKLAIASARRARYGHPHPEVIARLHRSRVAVLSTEEWGSIYWIPPKKKRPERSAFQKQTTK